MTVPWQDLVTRGFVVIPSFFSPDDLRIFEEDYSAQGLEANFIYPIKVTQLPSAPRFREKLMAVAEAAGRLGIQADIVLGGIYFATNLGLDLDWHQDRESYYQFQDHLNYLNFYIPIKKPVKGKSNISLIPFDELSKRFPDLSSRLRGKGAIRFHSKKDHTVVYDDNCGTSTVVPLNLNDVSVAPELAPGDLLLLRGDVIHKTQDTETDRIAVSIRMANGNGILSLRELTSLCWGKYYTMSRNHVPYQLQLECFEAARKKELTIGEYWNFAQGGGSRKNRPVSALKFTANLLRHWILARFPRREQLRP